MKNAFYFLHNLLQSKDYRTSFFKNLISYFKHSKMKFSFVLSLLYPLLIFYSLYICLEILINPYLAFTISILVSLVFVILLSIPSFYFIKGANLFDIKKIIEEVKKVKTKNKKYEKLSDVQINSLKKLYNNEARKYFNTAEYNFITFQNVIDKIFERDFNSKIYLNEEVNVKEFVSLLDKLILITGFDYIDLCKVFKFYIKGDYKDLNYNTVKVELSKFRKLTKK